MENSTGTTLVWERGGIYTQVAVSDGQIVGKAISADDPRTFALLTEGANFDNVHLLEKNMDYTQIVEMMGCEGLEILARINRDESPVTVNRLMRWTDESGTLMQILFNQDGTICTDDNSYTLYEFPTLEPGATSAPLPRLTPRPRRAPRPLLPPRPRPSRPRCPPKPPRLSRRKRPPKRLPPSRLRRRPPHPPQAARLLRAEPADNMIAICSGSK